MEKSLASSASKIVFPNHRDLSPQLIGFLDKHFSANENLSSLASKALELSKQYEKFETDLLKIQRKLGKLIVSWICRSVGVKTALHKLNLSFCNQYEDHKKMLGEDLPCLVKELSRIKDIRHYCETTLKLEALVGDFEDTVFSVMNHHTGDIVPANRSKWSSPCDLLPRHNALLQAVKTMNSIEELLVAIGKVHPQWIHLMKSVDARVDKTLAILRPKVLADHRALLVSLGWPPKLLTSETGNGTILDIPNPLVLMQVDKRKSYSDSFLVLCALQHLQAQREDRQHNLSGLKREGNIKLWAIDELVSPIASRTEYYFSKWTDQPELIFALVYNITRGFIQGVAEVLQPLIDRARLVSYSAKEAWVSAMIQMLSGHLARELFYVLAERYKEKHLKSEVISLWIHLIDLMLVFDRKMQRLVNSEIYLLIGGSERHGGLLPAISLMSIFCDRPDWIKIWAKIELRIALKKIKAELIEERSWSVDNKHEIGFSIDRETQELMLSSREDYKAPLIAEFSLNIAWDMIERCQNLPAISLRVQFIRSTTVKLLWYFFSVLVLHCKKAELYAGSTLDDSLKRFCIAINTARYCESKLLDWSDDVNLVEMMISGSDLNIHLLEDANDDSCFFREEIKSLVELQTTWVIELMSALLRHFETLSYNYVQSNERFKQKIEELGTIGESEAMYFTVSVDFVEALDTVRHQLHVIRMALNSKDFLDLWRSVADGLDHFIFRSILMSDTRFSDDGISQFGVDMQALFHVFQPFCLRPEAFFPCVNDTLKLLKIDKEEVKLLLTAISDDENRRYYFQSNGISHISFDQATKILTNRKST